MPPVAPAVIAAAISAAASAGTGITRGGPRRQYKWNKRAMQDQNALNRENQQWLMDQERKLQAEAREYDSPGKQMERYIAAGLNPHLIYGAGASSAGQAFPIHAGNMPAAQVAAPDASWPDITGSFLQAQQLQAQTGLTSARANVADRDAALRSIQLDIAKTNPMLSPDVAKAVSNSMLRVAELKGSEAEFMRQGWFDEPDKGQYRRIYVAKIEKEIEAMSQRLGLNTTDLQIKNRILESKEFMNEILELETKFIKDGEINSQHVWQALMLIMSKLLGRSY